MNLSSTNLLQSEIDLLSKGLKFTPTPGTNSEFTKADIHDFTRRVRLKEYFLDYSNNDDSIVSNPRNFTPERGRDTFLDNFVDYVNNIPVGQVNRKRIRSNLNKREKIALKRLRSRKSIIIKEADKGSGVVIMDKSFYKQKISEMLNDSTYNQIDNSLDKKTMTKIKHLIGNTDSTLTEKEIEYLTKFEMKTSQFYGLPKIHKSELIAKAVKEQNDVCIRLTNPDDLKFRPIVAGPACPTHRISDLLDKLLRPFIKHVKSYVRDDLDFLNHLPNQVDNSDFLVTMDISSLYSNIDHDLGRKAIAYWLEKHPHDLHNRFTKSFVLESMEIILNNNNFLFDGQEYIQMFGTAMGTKFAPTYATLVLGYLEEELYAKIGTELGEHIQEKFTASLRRYLDDVFFIWNNEVCHISTVLDMMNSMHDKINYTTEQSPDSIPFLDILVIKTGRKLSTDIYYKPTDTKQYLNYKSCHPRATKNNVPYNLARRICTIVSDPDIRKLRLEELKSSLLSRDYPEGVIKKGIEKASALDIATLRTIKENTVKDVTPFVNTHNPNSLDVFSQIREALPMLKGSQRMTAVLRNTPVINSKRQAPNLKRILTKARFEYSHETDIGSKPCGNSRCKCCRDILVTSEFYFHKSGHMFKIRNLMNCNSQNLIYVLICNGCHEYYIGQTGTDLRSRCRVHRQGVTNNSSIPVDQHITTCARNVDIKYNIIPFYKMNSTSKNARLLKEAFFIEKFQASLNRK